MNTTYLLLWLESPLQAWGWNSRFSRRDTLPFPTKSGVLGLLCCALGKGGEQREFLAHFAELTQTVSAFVRSKESFGQPVKKVKRAPLLNDFHMVGSGYDSHDAWQKGHIPRTDNSEKTGYASPKMTCRYYLQDAFFSVTLQVPTQILTDLVNALQEPVWDLYLGRKCCVPTDFIYRGQFETKDEASIAAQQVAADKNLVKDFEVFDKELGEGEHILLNDIPIQFGANKQYRDRWVTLKYV